MTKPEPLKGKVVLKFDRVFKRRGGVASYKWFFYFDDVKSAVEWFLKYKDRPELLVKEQPIYKKEVDEMWYKAKEKRSYSTHSAKEDFLKAYNEWLFKTAFEDVMKDEAR